MISENPLYSIRMRGSLGGKHSCGAERIVERDAVERVVQELTIRAFRTDPAPDHVVVHFDSLAGIEIETCRALDVTTIRYPDVPNSRAAAVEILRFCGVSDSAACHAVECLRNGPSPDGAAMRGAVIMDARTGERLEKDRERGVRASRFDWSGEALAEIRHLLESSGLAHFRTREALALATKVAAAPGVVAELCWSDDREYTAGYVASRKTGYIRFPNLKENGDPRGGRIIFIRNQDDLDACVEYLQSKPLLVSQTGSCRDSVSVNAFLGEIVKNRSLPER